MKRHHYKGLTALVITLALLLGGCSALSPKTDAISSATQLEKGPSKAPQWQLLNTSELEVMLADSGKKAAFIWFNGKELLVVGSLEDTPLPKLAQNYSAIDKQQLGYSFVAATPEAFSGIRPDCLVVAIPTMSDEALEALKLQLKDTLAGKAMQTLALDQFYFWQYEN